MSMGVYIHKSISIREIINILELILKMKKLMGADAPPSQASYEAPPVLDIHVKEQIPQHDVVAKTSSVRIRMTLSPKI